MKSVFLIMSPVTTCVSILCLPADAKTVGILAYGSVISDPGTEIAAAKVNSINADTPFKIEFGRSSRMRDGDPTLVPVEEGGAKVKAVVIILAPSVSEKEAADLLWRRETRAEFSFLHMPFPRSNLSGFDRIVQNL